MTRPRVAVVGGGIAGLAAAHALGDAADVLVLEASPRPGGLLRSERDGPYRFEHGPEGFLDDPDTLALVERLGLAGALVSAAPAARRRFVYRGGRLRALPESPPAFLRSDVLGLRGRLRALCEPLLPRRRAAEGADESLAAFARRRVGAEATRLLVDPIVSGIYAGDPEQLSAEAAFPRLVAFERDHGSLVVGAARAARARRGAARPTLRTFTDGMEALPRALAAALGPRLRLGATVRALEPIPGAGPARWRLHAEGEAPVEVEALLVATPPVAAAALLSPVDAALAATLREIPSASLAIVLLAVRADRVAAAAREGFGFLAPRGEGLRLLGTLFSSTLWPGRAPEAELLLRCMVGGARDEAALDLDDRALVDLARADLARALALEGPPTFARVLRHRRAIPQYTVGHARRLAAIAARVAALPGLHLIGHGYRGVGVNDCARDAVRVALEVRRELSR